MNSNKVLSVVVPSFNMQDYIGRNVESIISASCVDDIEIVIVNDGSTDETLKIAQHYEHLYPQSVRVIDKPNGHYGSCINIALQSVSGKYFRILDADDMFDTNALEVFVEKLKTTNAELVVTQRVEISIDENGKEKTTYFPLRNIEFGKVYHANTFSITDVSQGVEFNMHSMTYRTDVLRRVNLKLIEGVCYTDMIYCMIPISNIESLVVFDIFLYHYYVGREGSSTTDQSIKRNFSHICKVLSYLITYVQEHQGQNEIVRSNQMRWINEASGFFFASLKKQVIIRAQDYPLIKSIVMGWKKLGFSSGTYNKYYFKPWIKYNTHISLLISLWFYRIIHPFK
ncbi:MAG: glycosyltransferase family 2 protein [Prevotella sp.]|nr:glycosyltransferase family 2 protein [Prevotella sp.]